MRHVQAALLTAGMCSAAFARANAAPLTPAVSGSAGTSPRVLVATYAGVISPIAAEYLTAAIEKANGERDDALVIELDTPGGLDLSMRDIVKAELASKVPIIVYVWPAGARAASAGVFIAMAAHVAAMAPGTNIGAAHPIELGNTGSAGGKEEKGGQSEILETKVTNDAVAYLQSIARRRGRNADWAALVVNKSTSVPAGEAVREGVVDLEAEDLQDLLKKIDSRKISDFDKPLRTFQAQLARLEMTQRQKILATVVDPNVAMILMSVGVAGIMIELYSPGLILPGIVGAVSLITAFYSFQTLSASFAGLLLIALGFLLFILEFKVHSFGLLTLSGTASILFGALMLFRDSGGGVAVSKTTIAATIGPLLAFLFALLYIVRQALHGRSKTGAEGLKGAKCTTSTPLTPRGTVSLNSELWRAESVEGDIAQGADVVVVSSEGLVLKVRKARG
ncbi:MAG: nodulation protein NfeD [Elusimicrobia bacterium]|nr:nodulation protein NfeD [Elusimicrobiota bacterium]